jgi:tRNA(adenine34) deaminase
MIKKQDYEYFMNEALVLAKEAMELHEVPIGAIIVNSNGKIIGRGYNQVEQQKCQLGHAEVIAVKQATQAIDDWRLDGCWAFVSLEPCAMCINLMILSRVSNLVFGAESPVFGYSLDKNGTLQLYRRDTLNIVPHILKEESSALLKQFFRKMRKKGE